MRASRSAPSSRTSAARPPALKRHPGKPDRKRDAQLDHHRHRLGWNDRADDRLRRHRQHHLWQHLRGHHDRVRAGLERQLHAHPVRRGERLLDRLAQDHPRKHQREHRCRERHRDPGGQLRRLRPHPRRVRRHRRVGRPDRLPLPADRRLQPRPGVPAGLRGYDELPDHHRVQRPAVLRALRRVRLKDRAGTPGALPDPLRRARGMERAAEQQRLGQRRNGPCNVAGCSGPRLPPRSTRISRPTAARCVSADVPPAGQAAATRPGRRRVCRPT